MESVTYSRRKATIVSLGEIIAYLVVMESCGGGGGGAERQLIMKRLNIRLSVTHSLHTGRRRPIPDMITCVGRGGDRGTTAVPPCLPPSEALSNLYKYSIISAVAWVAFPSLHMC